MIKEYLKIAIKNLRTRSLRSMLTVLGIVIGVFLIVSLLSLSEGIKGTITKQLQTMGGDMIMVMPGDEANLMMAMMAPSEKLEEKELEAIKKTAGVERVLAATYQSTMMRYKKESKAIFLNSVNWKEDLDVLRDYQGWSLSEGRWPIPGKAEIIIGKQTAENTFKTKVKIGNEASIEGRRFEVVGILNSLGSKTDDSLVSVDSSIYENLTGAERNSAMAVMVKVAEGQSVDRVAQDLKDNLAKISKKKAGSDTAAFMVITSEKMGSIAGNILGVIQIAIIGFASIAIIVGGIGITNTMFTAVRERTREIGIMKAIGAKNEAVLSIFLIEAGIIGLGGGIGGTLLGTILAKIIEGYGQVHPMFYFKAAITPGLILFGFLFSLGVGCISGFIPARQAAKLKPIEALRRYE